MLIDYLESASNELDELERNLVEINKDYKRFFDRELKEQTINVRKRIDKKRNEVLDYLYFNMQELSMIKKNFPDFFRILEEDPHLSKVVERVSWILGSKKLDQKQCEQEIKRIKAGKKQLREARAFLDRWVGKIDGKSLEATWPILKGELKAEMEKEDGAGEEDARVTRGPFPKRQ